MKNSISLPRNRKKTENIHSVMMSMTTLTPYQNPTIFVISQKSRPKSA